MSTGLFADEEDGYNLEEDVKYKIKLAAPSTPALDVSTPTETGGEDIDLDMGATETPEATPSNDKPFDDTPFDAGVEADEDEDPEKYIQQLAGKLGTTLRKYSEDKGQPDFDLEKFAINSVISATHTGEMDEEDQKDIIKKIKNSGDKGKDVNVDVNVDTGDDEEGNMSDDEVDVDSETEEPLDEAGDLGFQPGNTDKSYFANDARFAPGAENQMWESDDLLSDGQFGDDIEVYENHENHEEGIRNEMFFNDIYSMYEDVCELLEMDSNQIDSILSDGHGWALDHVATSTNDVEHIYHYFEGQERMNEESESNNYMFFQNLKTLQHATHEILNMDVSMIDSEISNHGEWISNLAATAKDDIEEVYHFLTGQLGYDGENEAGYEDVHGSVESPEDNLAQLFIANGINEAEYKGKTVKLGKPMKGDVKKFKVYVKNKKGNVIKVNFGDPNMEIKRDNPERRKSFRARHKCSQAKDRTTPKYWSCKMWSRTPVSKMVAEGKKKKKKDACYHKVKSRYDVWPSAYASGALVKCRKVGAKNWGNKSNESVESIDEKKGGKTDYSKEKEKGLHGWFERQGGGWVDCNTCKKDSETGRKKCKPCGRKEGEDRDYPACRPTPASCGTKGKGEKWGKKSNESFDNSKKSSIFANELIKKLHEMEIIDTHEAITDNPVKEPVVIPETPVKPSPRRKRIWEAEPSKQPKPKMNIDETDLY